MKKGFLILSTIVLMLVFISTIISCNSTNSNKSSSPFIGNWATDDLETIFIISPNTITRYHYFTQYNDDGTSEDCISTHSYNILEKNELSWTIKDGDDGGDFPYERLRYRIELKEGKLKRIAVPDQEVHYYWPTKTDPTDLPMCEFD